ncbi:SH3 domain-containing protein [Arenimonas composti]|uniref:SH3b domain-containing protein n=1 Tax=Arenimonas composti TR7-09 = DSM 18010 TaxID=1121013 RepID=A0A091BL30_9GAMM|nr:SH3 domain-containing protein [Arenimonas composti]KFN51504.1 hypothetical protein P873_00155 [Arenimonas composti TR7-09 = DSM 18010]
MSTPMPLPFRRRVLVAALAAALVSGVALADSATVLKATDLRAEPNASAPVAGQVKPRDTVEVTAREGAWMNVTTAAGQAGWARMLNFRGVASADADRGSGADVGALFRAGSTGATATTGARALDAEDLRTAAPDTMALAQLDGFASSRDEASSFAGQAPVQAQRVDYLPEPRRSGRRSR